MRKRKSCGSTRGGFPSGLSRRAARPGGGAVPRAASSTGRSYSPARCAPARVGDASKTKPKTAPRGSSTSLFTCVCGSCVRCAVCAVLTVVGSNVHEFSWDVFSSLADEVVLCVFSHLGLEGLCRVSSVCRRWRRLADDDTLWESLLHRVIVRGAQAHPPTLAPSSAYR